MFRRLWDYITVTEKGPPPPRQCASCSYWLPPASLTVEITKSPRALEWARSSGYGSCRAPRKTDDGKDSDRFTRATAACKLWALKAGYKA